MLKYWQKNIKEISNQENIETNISNTYTIIMNWLHDNNFQGACHNISAAMYILLKEKNIDAILCIGEINNDNMNIRLDHSWIEINDKIYDVTIFMPLPSGVPFPPVFFSKNLDTNQITDFRYRGTKETDLDFAARTVYNFNLEQYAEYQQNELEVIRLWNLTKNLGELIGINLNIDMLKSKYGKTKRVLK